VHTATMVVPVGVRAILWTHRRRDVPANRVSSVGCVRVRECAGASVPAPRNPRPCTTTVQPRLVPVCASADARVCVSAWPRPCGRGHAHRLVVPGRWRLRPLANRRPPRPLAVVHRRRVGTRTPAAAAAPRGRRTRASVISGRETRGGGGDVLPRTHYGAMTATLHATIIIVRGYVRYNTTVCKTNIIITY